MKGGALAQLVIERAGRLNCTLPEKGNQLFVIEIVARYAAIAVLFSAATAFPAQAQPDGETNRYEGRCAYGSQIERASPQAQFATCRSLTIERNGNAGSIDYLNSLGGSTIRYDGVFDGNEMTIHSLATRSGGTRAATGGCRIRYIDDRLSSVTCVGEIGIHKLAANFVRQRINL